MASYPCDAVRKYRRSLFTDFELTEADLRINRSGKLFIALARRHDVLLAIIIICCPGRCLPAFRRF